MITPHATPTDFGGTNTGPPEVEADRNENHVAALVPWIVPSHHPRGIREASE